MVAVRIVNLGIAAFAAAGLTGPLGLGLLAAFVIGARIGLPQA